MRHHFEADHLLDTFVIGLHAFVVCVVIFLGVYFVVVTTTGTVWVVGGKELVVETVRFSMQEPTTIKIPAISSAFQPES